MMSLVLFFSFPTSYSSSVIAAQVTRTVRADSITVRVPSVPLGSIAGDEIAAYSFTTATYFYTNSLFYHKELIFLFNKERLASFP